MYIASVVKRRSILICDDHVLFCTGLKQLLSSTPNDFDVHVVHNSAACIEFFRTNSVDVFICDLNIDHQDGFELIENLRPQLGDSKVIILSAYFEEYLIHKARKQGVFAFLKKETTVEELIDVIDRKQEEGFYSQPTPFSKQNAFLNQDENFVNKFKLSKQEREIIKWIVQGKLSKEIGELLFISKTTVDTHRRNINRKLNVSSVGELIKFANENNIA